MYLPPPEVRLSIIGGGGGGGGDGVGVGGGKLCVGAASTSRLADKFGRSSPNKSGKINFNNKCILNFCYF